MNHPDSARTPDDVDAREAHLRAADLHVTTRSGLRSAISGFGDWCVFEEIFVQGCYDEFIDAGIHDAAARRRPLFAVDLGANVGFFALRLLDRWRSVFPDFSGLRIVAVEANPASVARLQALLALNPGLDQVLIVVGAAVGLRSGSVRMVRPLLHSCSSVRGSPRTEGTPSESVDVPYIDIDALLAGHAIDLLKVDIEGSEQDLLATSPGLFARTQALFMEIHPSLCDAAACLRALNTAGLGNFSESLADGHPLLQVASRRRPQTAAAA